MHRKLHKTVIAVRTVQQLLCKYLFITDDKIQF